VDEGEDGPRARSALHVLPQRQSESSERLLPFVESSENGDVVTTKDTRSYAVGAQSVERSGADELSTNPSSIEYGIPKSDQGNSRQAQYKFMQIHNSKSILSFGVFLKPGVYFLCSKC
jgi:hypothetical protein